MTKVQCGGGLIFLIKLLNIYIFYLHPVITRLLKEISNIFSNSVIHKTHSFGKILCETACFSNCDSEQKK